MNDTLYSAEVVRKLRAERDAAIADKAGFITTANRFQEQFEAMASEIVRRRGEWAQLVLVGYIVHMLRPAEEGG